MASALASLRGHASARGAPEHRGAGPAGSPRRALRSARCAHPHHRAALRRAMLAGGQLERSSHHPRRARGGGLVGSHPRPLHPSCSHHRLLRRRPASPALGRQHARRNRSTRARCSGRPSCPFGRHTTIEPLSSALLACMVAGPIAAPGAAQKRVKRGPRLDAQHQPRGPLHGSGPELVRGGEARCGVAALGRHVSEDVDVQRLGAVRRCGLR